MKPYNKKNIPLAKKLRRNMTPWERKLWYDYLRYYPIRFQRQKVLGEYIGVFYCAKARLVIELDGGGHYEPRQAIADRIRTERLEDMNLTVIRICNLDVDKNFTGVCEYIDMTVKKALPQSASLTAPSTEGALGDQKKIIALGFFDGVHLGHQALLNECCRMAKALNCETAAITFEEHPQSLFLESPPALINTVQDRRSLLLHYGIDHVYTFPVTQKVMSTDWAAFLEQLLEDGAAGFVCGSDFRFGYRGEGDAQKLEGFCLEHGLSCSVVDQQMLDGIRISSTHIRTLLEAGEMAQAVRFLGHPHILTGTVVPGRHLGRTIGIPTANLTLPEDVVQLRRGVYICRVLLEGETFLAVTNVGTRPTVGGTHVTVESWLLDFDGELYGKELTLEFYSYLRPEVKFPSLEALREEIQKNAQEVRKFFDKN